MTWPLWLQVLVVLATMLSPFILGWCQGAAREETPATLRTGKVGHATYTELPRGEAHRILTTNKIVYIDSEPFPQ